jgi:hypothetical protein
MNHGATILARIENLHRKVTDTAPVQVSILIMGTVLNIMEITNPPNSIILANDPALKLTRTGMIV